MTVTDQQLRQELISYGETVPPITQRNREQLRARLEVLQSRTRTRTPASPARSQATTSPSRSQATASPSRTTRAAASPSRSQATASPSRSQATASPSRTTRATASPAQTPTTAAASSPSRSTRAVASPARSLVTSSPSRTRSSITTTTIASRQSTRSKQTTNLIELSDSETDSATAGVLGPRSTRSAQSTAAAVQTRSTASRRQNESPTSPTNDIPGPTAVFGDIEQSIARHRREIKQLLDSARDRNRISNSTTPSKSVQVTEQNETPVHPSSKSRAHRKASKSDNDDDKHDAINRSPKPATEKQKKSSVEKCLGKTYQSCWTKHGWLIKNFLKVLLISSIIIGGAVFLFQNRDLFSPPKEINCSAKDSTECEDMKALVAVVRKQLQIRTGEVECGVRQKNDVFVSKSEVEKYLSDQGFTFTSGDKERWNALVNYVLNGDAKDILVWTKNGTPTTNPVNVEKLSTKYAVHSLVCYVRQDLSDTSKRVIVLVLGFIGLLTLVWYIRKQSKVSKENEKQVKDILGKVTNILKEQYEKHIHDPQAKPWVAINQIYDALISKEEQQKLKSIWERVGKQINRDHAQFSSEIQEVDGKNVDVWRWLKSTSASPKKTKSENVKNSNEETESVVAEVGLTECLKLRNCFRSDKFIDEGEINQVIEIIRKRCADVKSIDHIGIHTIFVYLKFSSKEAAAQGYHLLNEWNCQNRPLNVKYIRLSRYHDHFPEARDASPK